MSGGFLYYLIKVKKQPFFLNASQERGWLRPRPLHSYHLIVFAYMLFEGLHMIFLVNELYPNMIAAELGNVMADAFSAAAATLYPVSIVYSTPNVQLKNENSNFKNFNYVGPSARLVDIVGIILFFEPLVTLFPLAYLAGHYAEIDDLKMANAFYSAHYFAWVAWEITYLTVLAYYWYRLTSIIKKHIKVLEERESTGVVSNNHIQSIKRGTRNAIIYVVMCLTHRSSTIYNFGWSTFYYWIGYVAFPLLGFSVESTLIYFIIKNLRKSPPGSSNNKSTTSSSSQSQLNSNKLVNAENQITTNNTNLSCIPNKKFSISINKPTMTVIHCTSEITETITLVEDNNKEEIP
ncbi:4165_t:CDS:2 [Funneliformis geosporum]|uniref:1670_t:CDS:1 n=1 Tax=Funneliformis geosporum TaxID=1117311 RepID=A0A9W4SAX2_9GLOM|nr:1670_t:CDS:2 [Funneliformis geosporum]CAI2167219.1 4165_t:CDS:2 [Funneliformis geosporum]